MDARLHQRVKLSIPVSLYSRERHGILQRRSANISLGGLFVSGSPCGCCGSCLEVMVDIIGMKDVATQALIGEVVRLTSSGFALRFRNPVESQRRMLERLLWPRWDGANLFEGMLLLTMREEVTDLASWMRLTSLLCGPYKRLCCMHATRNERSRGQST